MHNNRVHNLYYAHTCTGLCNLLLACWCKLVGHNAYQPEYVCPWIKGFLCQSNSAAQMWVLSVNLPLLIGNKIPEISEEWECFLLLLDIVKLCTSRSASKSHVGYLEVLIHSHHQLFVKCYPTARITPKMHYMVHFPQQILR